MSILSRNSFRTPWRSQRWSSCSFYGPPHMSYYDAPPTPKTHKKCHPPLGATTSHNLFCGCTGQGVADQVIVVSSAASCAPTDSCQTEATRTTTTSSCSVSAAVAPSGRRPRRQGPRQEQQSPWWSSAATTLWFSSSTSVRTISSATNAAGVPNPEAGYNSHIAPRITPDYEARCLV